MKDVVIVGSSGFGKEVAWLISEINKASEEFNILGWVSDEPEGKEVFGYTVLGNDDWLFNQSRELGVVIALGDGKLRRKLVEKYKSCTNLYFPNIVGPSVIKSESVKLGEGVIIGDGSVFTVDISIGNFFVCNQNVVIGHDGSIGDYVSIFAGTDIAGNVQIDSGSTLGIGSTVKQGIHIGENAYVGAGAVVVKDVRENTTVAGVPAKELVK